ncbi:dihydrofolate reductase [Pseudalgibacter alginicilyticus]|uniref:dihydrofolate reductase n=1 Tax=Pseudalgibacter alginicilyticus TaxID=1736674 RepID=A0A0N7HYG9_9FLAO|nr:dihydrofolate reductase [Pseudalgibacter alginicilyticus]ALJ05222.1 dihydrofolate reductase [Pseudalgibacter alginicilyticus]
MFGKKKLPPQIDKDQLELIQNAQKRIKQKKRLYAHFVIFLLGAVFLILANTVLGIGQDITFFGKEWFLFAILIWSFFFIYHLFNVFITHKFMGKDWEQKQLDKLVAKQKERIDILKKNLSKEEIGQAKNEVLKEQKSKALKLNKSNLTIIVAAAKNDAIGKDNKLIWHLSDDLKRFKNLTNGHHIIMGRKTFESFPQPLPNRTHVVITRQQNYQVPNGVIVVNNLEDAIDASKNDSQPFIIGGGEIYKQAMTVANKIELTRVHNDFEADTFFPEIDPSAWEEVSNTYHEKDENHKYDFSFITYLKK